MAGPAAGGLAEQGGKLAFGQRPATVDAGAVGGRRSLVDVHRTVFAGSSRFVHIGPAGCLLGREPVFTIRARLSWSTGPARANDWTGAVVTRTTMAAVSPRAARIRRQILIPGRDQPESGDRLVRWTNAVVRRRFAGHGASGGAASRCRAAYSTTIDDEYTSPSIVAGSSRAVIPVSPWARTTSKACQ